MKPPLPWEMAYAWTEKCLHDHGDFGRVQFALADSISMQGVAAYGIWFVESNGAHVIVYRTDQTGSLDLIVHEMIHDIEGDRGGEWPPAVGEKPSPYFARCLPSMRKGS